MVITTTFWSGRRLSTSSESQGRSAVSQPSVFFFFSSRRRHTRLQGDWSSDVCSSDLDRAKEKYGVGGSRGDRALLPEQLRDVEGEIGDLMFTLVNLARYLTVDPESALKKTNRKFRRRFQYLESRLKQRGSKLESASLEEMESLWQEAKTSE